MMNIMAVKPTVKGSLCLYMAAGVNQSKMRSPVLTMHTVRVSWIIHRSLTMVLLVAGWSVTL